MGTLHEYQYTFLIISRSVLLRMKNIPDKCSREIQNTHVMFNNFFLNRAVHEVMWGVEEGRRDGQTTNNNMAHAHCLLDT